VKRTSLTHPLRIDSLSAGTTLGRVGITFCPGKYDENAATGSWDRDLNLDLEAIRDWGAAAVVTLVESHELTLLGVERLGEETVRRGMRWFHLPIADVSTPDEEFEQRWDVEGAEICALLREGRDVLVHCRGGLGRAGTIGARLLVELGMEPAEAIRQVRAVRPGAIETSEQERYVLGLERAAHRGRSEATPGLSLFDRIYGCLLGGACGDALGAPVEFLSHDMIAARYGVEGISQFDTAYGGIGLVTDDTQMALFTVEGLIRAWVRGTLKGICHPPGVVHHAYLRWLTTQDRAFEALPEIERADEIDGWLIREKRLWAARAPGNTCLSALRVARSSRQFGGQAANDSKGCGTVMRDAPFGLFRLDDPALAFEWAVETAWTTHGHPSARYSSGALAVIIAHIGQGEGLSDAVSHALSMLPGGREASEVRDALRRAVDLSRAPDWRGRLPELGAGWVAEEALAISILCALAAKDAREAIVAAVNHGGDSDSTGAIVGNIVGTIGGAAALPAEWTEQVELRDVIETLSRDLVAILDERHDEEALAEQMSDRYPGW
jgi:ADP-ribosyl-[dinitrogen reductase] hydrolase